MAKKLTNRQKLLIRNGVLAGANIAGGITGLVLATNPLFLAVGVATLAVGGVWSYLETKLAIKAIKKVPERQTEPKNPRRSFKQWRADRKAHKKQYKEALIRRREIEKAAKKDFKNKKTTIYKEEHVTDKLNAYRESVGAASTNPEEVAIKKKEYTDASKAAKVQTKEAKIEEKGTLKALPKKAKGFKVARGCAITIAVISGALTLVTGGLLAGNFLSAHASANEVNGSANQYLQVEAANNNAAGAILAGVNIANAVFATKASAKMAKKREDIIIQKYGAGPNPDESSSSEGMPISYDSSSSGYNVEL